VGKGRKGGQRDDGWGLEGLKRWIRYWLDKGSMAVGHLIAPSRIGSVIARSLYINVKLD
jgi:hypothetical protein